MEAKPWIALIGFLFVVLATGSLASFLTARGVRDWYPQLRKPPGTPPSWVFGPVWTALYVLMAISAWLIWRNYGWSGGRSALFLFFGQLALNAAWSGIFFGARLPGPSLQRRHQLGGRSQGRGASCLRVTLRSRSAR